MNKSILIIVSLGVVVSGVYCGKSDYDAKKSDIGSVVQVTEDSNPSKINEMDKSGLAPTKTSTREKTDRKKPKPKKPSIKLLKKRVSRTINRAEAQVVQEGFSVAGKTARQSLQKIKRDYGSQLQKSKKMLAVIEPLRRLELKMLVFGKVADQIKQEKNPDQALVKKQSNEISKKVDKLSKPIDIYFKGVTTCFRLGLQKKGYEILEKLLAMPDSEEIVANFVEEDSDLVSIWNQAAGRIPLGSLTKEEKSVKSKSSHSTSSSVNIGVKESINKVKKLLAKAQAIYKKLTVDKIGDLKELHVARQDLEDALGILDLLSSEKPSVKELKNEVNKLHGAVMKSLPF